MTYSRWLRVAIGESACTDGELLLRTATSTTPSAPTLSVTAASPSRPRPRPPRRALARLVVVLPTDSLRRCRPRRRPRRRPRLALALALALGARPQQRA